MPDLLVNLLRIPPLEPSLLQLERAGIVIRRAQAFEMTPLRLFDEEKFSIDWMDEVSVGFTNRPVSVHLATRNRTIIGSAAHECTRRAFFGPAGVAPDMRGRGIGRALLIASLQGLRDLGYVYGIIGGAGPGFIRRPSERRLFQTVIPGIYTDRLTKQV